MADSTTEGATAPILIFPKPPTPTSTPPSTPSPPLLSTSIPILTDPPPPYPTRERRNRAGTTRSIRRLAQVSSDSGAPPYTDHDTLSPTEDDAETTPLLSPHRRQRTISHSTVASSHSLAHTVLSLFQTEGEEAALPSIADSSSSQPALDMTIMRRLRRYFRPMRKGPYYKALFHLLVINFPFALLAFILLFVGTLLGTTLLIALPLGVVISWFNFVCARAFAQWELSLQSKFHGPLAFDPPGSPHPIFSRSERISSSSVIESGDALPQERTSFLRDTYAMFTDPTSYQALFYFLVIKSSITLLLSIALVAVVPASFILIFPAPAVLRAVKRIGSWQANIAVEGLIRPRL